MEKKVFIIEDDDGIREMLEYILAARGFKTISCPSVQSYRENIKLVLPDLIVLDIMLPDGSGADVGIELRQNPLTAYIPILFMTANLKFNFDGETASHDFIRKPFDIHEFVRKIDDLLRKSLAEHDPVA
ncbi:MAG: response regulator [Ferruginibacter sp.]